MSIAHPRPMPETPIPTGIETLSFELDAAADGACPLTHPYVETFWLPVLGPTSTLLLRHVGARAAAGRFETSVADLSASLGLGSSTGRNSSTIRSLNRLERFGLARLAPPVDGNLDVTLAAEVRVVDAKLRQRWPEGLRIAHSRAEARLSIDAAQSGGGGRRR